MHFKSLRTITLVSNFHPYRRGMSKKERIRRECNRQPSSKGGKKWNFPSVEIWSQASEEAFDLLWL
jgi:hypothetical protein